MTEAPTQPLPVEITAPMHKKLAIELFNATWDLIDKADRTAEENDAMIHHAHASCYHWSQVGTAQNLAVGAWQIAHVYTVLQQGEAALNQANRCLEICVQHNIGDWRLAFAMEALARAYAAAGDTHNARRRREQAMEIGLTVQEEGERTHFLTELERGPWFGVE